MPLVYLLRLHQFTCHIEQMDNLLHGRIVDLRLTLAVPTGNLDHVRIVDFDYVTTNLGQQSDWMLRASYLRHHITSEES